MTQAPSAASRAWFGLAVLTIINLLNYTDRYIVAGVMADVQGAFHLNDKEGGLLATSFMIAYLVASPIGGYLGDRLPRRVLVGSAVLLWSLATIASGLATSFGWLVAARAATGIGEAGYGTIAPALISDLFTRDRRSRMLAIFYTAMPLGAAAGYIAGGTISEHFGWHAAFFAGGAPGIVLGIAAFFMPEPSRGATEEAPVAKVSFGAGLAALARNRRFWVVTAGLTLMTFSIGGLSNWMPKFLQAERGFSGSSAGFALGVTTVIGGFAGTLLGGVLADRFDKRMPGGGVLMSGVGLVLAAPLMVLAAHVESHALLLVFLVLAQVLIFLNNGPLNAAVVNVVPVGFRAFAFSVCTLTLHLLGDAASPVLIGAVSDASSLGHAITLNAVPVLVGGVVLLLGVRSFRTAASAPATLRPAA